MVNEYGTVDHDGGVLERDGYTDGVEKLAGGCVCCQGSLGDELEDKVGELLRRPDHADDRRVYYMYCYPIYWFRRKGTLLFYFYI